MDRSYERLKGARDRQINRCADRKISFEIDAQGGTRCTGARQPEHRARSVVKEDADPLMLAFRSVDRIVIGKVIGPANGQLAARFARQPGRAGFKMFYQLFGRFCVDIFEVMTCEIVATGLFPMAIHDLVHRTVTTREDI